MPMSNIIQSTHCLARSAEDFNFFTINLHNFTIYPSFIRILHPNKRSNHMTDSSSLKSKECQSLKYQVNCITTFFLGQDLWSIMHANRHRQSSVTAMAKMWGSSTSLYSQWYNRVVNKRVHTCTLRKNEQTSAMYIERGEKDTNSIISNAFDLLKFLLVIDVCF